MGDPVSLAGTAVGIVSLGLTVCQGLVSYYSVFRAYSEDTRNVLEKLEGLKDVLAVLEDVLQSHDDLRTETAATRTAKRNIVACKSGLEQLKGIMDRCKATDCSPGKQKRDHIKRALYPFQRGTIKSLLEHVESLQSNLNTSMDVLQLSVVSRNSERTRLLCITTEQTLTESTRIYSHVKNIEQAQQDISCRISGIDQRLTDMYSHLSRQNGPILEPTALKLLCDTQKAINNSAVSFDTQVIPISRRKRTKCSCSSLPASSRARKGLFASLWDSPHNFGCPLYFHEEKIIFGRKLEFCNRFLGASVYVCLKSVRGAGGHTICPFLSFCPIVDQAESPAFQLVSEASSKLREGASPDLFRTLVSQLRSVYEEGKASPRDIDYYLGCTVLHKVIKWIRSVPEPMMEDYRGLIKSLVEFGVPVNEQTYQGTALDTLLIEGSHGFSVRSGLSQDQMVFIFSDLVAYGTDLTQGVSKSFRVAKYWACISGDITKVHCPSKYIYAVASRNMYEDFYSSDLERSIILRSERHLHEMISLTANREAPAEDTYLAQLSIGWPSGLRIILNAGYRLNTTDLLHCAIESRCCESASLLLNDSNSPIDLSHLQAAYNSADSDIFELVVRALAERRRNLQILAERHLPVQIRDQLDLPTHGVLDSHAAQVYSKLKKFGIQMDPCLKISWGLSTVYDCIDHDCLAAKTLFNAGFRNFEEEEEGKAKDKGLTTLMRVARSSRYYARAKLSKVLDTMGFLISKGADPHRRRRGDGRTALHFLGSGVTEILHNDVLKKIWPKNSSFWTWDMASSSKVRETIFEVFHGEWSQLNHSSRNLLETLFMDHHCDACSCACSAQGCLPCTGIFRELVTWTDSPPNTQAMAEIIRVLSERRGPGSVKACHDTLAPTILRVCIFDYLELTHTCCERTDYWDNMAYRAEILNDIPHIRDEQRLLIEELEKLTAFFMSKYHEMGLGLPEFLLGYWSVEIKKVSKPDTEEVRRIKSVGVVLDE